MGEVNLNEGDKVTVKVTVTVGGDDGNCVCTGAGHANIMDADYVSRLINMSDKAWIVPSAEKVRIK